MLKKDTSWETITSTTLEIVTDGQIIFSGAAAAVYMGPYCKSGLDKSTFF
jgi:hypothetical protein